MSFVTLLRFRRGCGRLSLSARCRRRGFLVGVLLEPSLVTTCDDMADDELVEQLSRSDKVEAMELLDVLRDKSQARRS